MRQHETEIIDCSPDTGWTGIAAALAAAAPGQTLRLLPGHWQGGEPLRVPSGITIVGTPGSLLEWTSPTAPRASGHGAVLLLDAVEDVTLIGLRIRSRVADVAEDAAPDRPGIVLFSSQARAEANACWGNGHSGIMLQRGLKSPDAPSDAELIANWCWQNRLEGLAFLASNGQATANHCWRNGLDTIANEEQTTTDLVTRMTRHLAQGEVVKRDHATRAPLADAALVVLRGLDWLPASATSEAAAGSPSAPADWLRALIQVKGRRQGRLLITQTPGLSSLPSAFLNVWLPTDGPTAAGGPPVPITRALLLLDPASARIDAAAGLDRSTRLDEDAADAELHRIILETAVDRYVRETNTCFHRANMVSAGSPRG